jgi:hypothetical protein
MALDVLTVDMEALEGSAGKDGEPLKCHEKWQLVAGHQRDVWRIWARRQV